MQRLTGPPDMQSSSSRASRQEGGQAGQADGQQGSVTSSWPPKVWEAWTTWANTMRGSTAVITSARLQLRAVAMAVQCGAERFKRSNRRAGGFWDSRQGSSCRCGSGGGTSSSQQCNRQAGRQAGSGGSSFRTHLEEKAMARPITTMDRF